MKRFLPGLALPFQKGKAPDRPVEVFHPATPLRIPLMLSSADGARQKAPELAEDRPVRAGAVLLEEPDGVPAIANHAGTVAGTVVIEHPQYGEMLCAELHPTEGEEELLPVTAPAEITAQLVLDAAREAAIYDELDGVCLFDKLTAWQLSRDDAAALHSVLVADATENDIFGSAAWAALDEHAEEALDGLQLAAKALRFTRYHIAAMLPKTKRRALKRTIGREHIFIVGDEYPVTAFAEGRAEVFRIGVQACIALSRAVRRGEKSTGIILTVAGSGVKDSRNLWVPYGTDIREILQSCQAFPDSTVILGDAMNGMAITDTHTPLLPGTTALLAIRDYPVRTPRPCIGCGRCAAVCHAGLLPYEIVRRHENMHYERLRHLAPEECDGCGLCSYVCPSQRDVTTAVLAAGESGGTMFLDWGGEQDE